MKTFGNLVTSALLLALMLGLAPGEANAQKKKGGTFAGSRGAKVTSVLAGWPAADAGLEVGDIITYVDDVQVTSEAHLRNGLAGKSEARLTVINVRDGSTIRVTAYPSGGKLGITMSIVDVTPREIFSPGRRKP